MYNAFFGFTENPFILSPDPSFLFRSVQHEEALANLIYGVQSRKGFIVLSGEVGTGKTMMLECLRDFLEAQQILYAYLFNSRITPGQFFDMFAYDLGLECRRDSKTEVLLALNQLLLERAQNGRTTALIVDEAHNLDWDVLEEIRLLGNLENRRGKMLQIVLAGQQELGPQDGCARVPPVETKDRAALHAEAARRIPDGGIYRFAPGPRRHAGPGSLPPQAAGRHP